jgi:putative zinc finger protein
MTATMDHTDATLSGAAERYILGEMTTEERERYEAHFFACAECGDEVRAAARFVENARGVLAAMPAESRAATAAAPAPREAAPSWWRSLLASFGPVPLGALATAAVLLVALGYQTLVVVPGLRQQLRNADGLQAAPAYFLSVARGEPPVVQLTPAERVASITLSRSLDRPFPYYRVDVLDGSGRLMQSGTVPARPGGEELTVTLHAQGLPAGAYTFVVAGLESEASRTPASDSIRYPFRLEWRDAPR